MRGISSDQMAEPITGFLKQRYPKAMESPIFEVRGLSCSYDGGKSVVLEVPELRIERGKLVMLVGGSGSGKSTLLETLGLMNNTMVHPDSSVYFQPDANGPRHALHDLWSSGNTRVIADIRRRYFSFIFQETNLMQNFTAWENVLLSQLIACVPLKVAEKRASDALKRVGLTEVDQNRLPKSFSGGQQQRLAFVRAITSEFMVLFCDEPTGNLDEENAEELMTYVRETIVSRHCAGVIVTHDIRLAEKFGDEIWVLRKLASKYPAIMNFNGHFIADRNRETPCWKVAKSKQPIECLHSHIRALFYTKSIAQTHEQGIQPSV
jgi:putative ABC transport system ATP-binding protein